jgi:hypothetical protein
MVRDIRGFMNKMSRSNRREDVSIKQERGCLDQTGESAERLATKRRFKCTYLHTSSRAVSESEIT